MSDRIARLRAALPELGAGSFLVTRPVNLRYLTGFESSNAALAVSSGRLVVATDGRYLESARALEGVEVVQADRDLLGLARRPTRRAGRGARSPSRPTTSRSPATSRSGAEAPSFCPRPASSRGSARSRTRTSSPPSAERRG